MLEVTDPGSTIQVTTENSVWLIDESHYMRVPRDGAERAPTPSVDGRLNDSVWHRHRGYSWVDFADGTRRINLHPEVGPEDGRGILTGVVEKVEGWPGVIPPEDT